MHIPKVPRLPWHNDYPLSAEDVARIVAADVTEFARCGARVLGEGWDYTTFVVDDRAVFRFPKRRQCVRPLKREIASLAHLRQRIAAFDVAIPDYQWTVEHPRAFPLLYAGYPFLSGRPLVEIAATDCDARAIATSIGRLLANVRSNAPTKAPRPSPDDFSPSDVLHDLDQAAPAMPVEIVAACRTMLARWIPVPPVARAFSHGDLGVEHVLVDEQARVVALIDWGDLGYAHVAHDFVGFWAWGGDAVARFAIDAADAQLSADDWKRMRFAGICYAIGTVYYGYKDGHDALRLSGLEWLARAFARGQIEDPSRPDG